jgi:putative FmdB family regulatory protein
MPIYEYRCNDCGKIAEFQMKISDPHPQDCPACGHAALRKIMSLPAFQLKGGGWYAEGYDGKSNKKADSSSATESKAADSKASEPAAPAAPAASSSSPKSSD